MDPNTAVAVVAGATVVYAFLTLLLLLEARANRNTRLEANVAAYPSPFRQTGQFMEVVAENYGPASATDVVVFMRFRDTNGREIGASELRHGEPVWGPGRIRRFIPRPDGHTIKPLQELADSGLWLYLEWQWTDGARTLRDVAGRRPARHVHSKLYDLRRYSQDIYEGKSLVDPDPLLALPKIHEDLVQLRRVLERTGTTPASTIEQWIEGVAEAGDATTAPQPTKLESTDDDG